MTTIDQCRACIARRRLNSNYIGNGRCQANKSLETTTTKSCEPGKFRRAGERLAVRVLDRHIAHVRDRQRESQRRALKRQIFTPVFVPIIIIIIIIIIKYRFAGTRASTRDAAALGADNRLSPFVSSESEKSGHFQTKNNAQIRVIQTYDTGAGAVLGRRRASRIRVAKAYASRQTLFRQVQRH